MVTTVPAAAEPILAVPQHAVLAPQAHTPVAVVLPAMALAYHVLATLQATPVLTTLAALAPIPD